MIIHGDCREVKNFPKNSIIVTDPPFNIGYKYKSYKDNVSEEEYLLMMKSVVDNGGGKAVIVQYPEKLHELSIALGKAPERVVSWVYNSNTRRQHRDIAFYGIAPNFQQVRQPYKNPTDKRIKERIERGLEGASLYDWWNINQVKNVSKKAIGHPCVMPVEVMKNIIGILPQDCVIVDPFCGSGTTGVACALLGREFIGIEIDEEYCRIAEERIKQWTERKALQ